MKSKLPIFLMLGGVLLLLLPLYAQDFEIPVTVTDGLYQYVLTFGVDPNGTSVFDPGLDVLAPPPPPTGAFDARLIGPDLENYFKDIRENTLTEKTFRMKYAASTGQGPIVLTWDNTLLDTLGTFFIVDDITGGLYGPLDMKLQNSLTINDPLILNGLRILVTPAYPNHAPVARDDSATVAEDGWVNIDVLANDTDVDNDTLLIQEVLAGAITGQVTILSGNMLLKYQTAPNYFGTEVFHYVVTDQHGGLDTAQVTVIVTPVNDPPVAVNDTVTTVEDSMITIPVLQNDSDPEGDPLTVTGLDLTATQGNAWITGGGSAVEYQPAPEYSGGDMFYYQVSDNNGGYDTALVVITVLPVNDPPVALNDTLMTLEDQPAVLDVLQNDTDTEGDPLQIVALDTVGLMGTLQLLPGDTLLEFTPAPNYFGTTGFGYTISDGNGGSASAQVQLRVKSVNDPPVISGLPSQVVFRSDSSAELDIWSFVSDVETPDDLLQYQFSASNDSLLRNYNNSTGILVLSAETGFAGDVLLYITVTDDSGATAMDTLPVFVTPPVGFEVPTNDLLPRQFVLFPNYPNPFNQSTIIRFAVPRPSRVVITLYDVLGKKSDQLFDREVPAGYYTIHYDGNRLASGFYYIQMQAEQFRAVRRMLLLK